MGDISQEPLFNQASEKDGDVRNLRVFNPKNPIEGYVVSDKDDDASPNYYGYLDKDGNWYIMKETVLAGNDSYRFVKGTSGYATNWVGRAGLSYDYFSEVF